MAGNSRIRTLCAYALVALMLAAAGTAATAQPATAAETELNARCVDIPWYGQMTTGTFIPKNAGKPSVAGSAKVCATMYRVSESNSKYDRYYVMVELRELTDKTNKLGKSYFTGKAPWAIKVRSNTATYGSDYSATKTFSRKETACGTFSVAAGISFVSASYTFPEVACNKAVVTRSDFTSTSVKWSNGNIRDFREATVAYGQAVAAGKVPKFTIEVVRPYYLPVFTDNKDRPREYWDLAMNGSTNSYVFVLAK